MKTESPEVKIRRKDADELIAKGKSKKDRKDDSAMKNVRSERTDKKRNGYKTMKKGVLAAGCMVLTAFMAGGCADKEKADEVHIGYFNNVTHAQALYMKAQGMLDEAFPDGTQVTWTAFNAGPSEVEALFAGDIDIGYIGPVPAITANVKSDGDVLILSGAAMAGAELVCSPEEDIARAADLDGKTVAVPQIGNTQHLCLLKLLADNGLASTEAGGTVTVTAVENADVQNMMDQGNIDAALVPEPWGATLVEGGAKIVLDYDEVYENGDYPVTVVVVRKDFMEENPQLVSAFLEKHEEATKAVAQDEAAPDIVNEEISAATGKSLTPSVLKSAFEKLVVSTKINRDAVESFAEISLEQGFIAESYESIFAELPKED